MPESHAVRGILFDAGGVLTRPVGGRWNPRYDFEGIVARHRPEVAAELFPAAIEAGQRALDASPNTLARESYHRTMLRVLGVDDPSPALLAELEAPAAGPVIEVYPEVRGVLDELQRRGLPMAVVSDTWVGLEMVFRSLDIEHYFAGFVISEVLGCNKPDPRMYAAGSDILGLPPTGCLFIDDDPELVAAAVALGYQGVALTRPVQAVDQRNDRPVPGIRMVSSLEELLPLVTAPA